MTLKRKQCTCSKADHFDPCNSNCEETIEIAITIKPIKDSYSRSEVDSLIRQYSKECTGQPWFDTDEKWIENNL